MISLTDIPCIFVVFGGTGDLTHRKLIPAIYNLVFENKLRDNFAVVSIGRKNKTDEEYRRELSQSVQNYSRFEMDDEKWDHFRKRIFYKKLEFTEQTPYIDLKNFLNDLDKNYETKGNRIFYLAVAPEHFQTIISNIKASNMAPNKNSWQRLIIEKPFGVDVETAHNLNNMIKEVFQEKDTYRIDHYLGKEMIQNIMVIRFANTIFESIWSGSYIDNIQITSSETVGSENRAGYYEKSGVLRDMIQNHMLQLLSLIAMEKPKSLETEDIRDEKVAVIRSLEVLDKKAISENIIRGQYGIGVLNHKSVVGYRQEEKVSPISNTETFIAMKLYVENPRWRDMPFYLRSGKRLSSKRIDIVVQFKDLPQSLYFKDYGLLQPNLLVIKIHPSEGVSFNFNGKKPGTGNEIEVVNMDYCQSCNTMNNSPEAYERLIYDCLRGDSTLFARWDEIEASWKFVDRIGKAWEEVEPDFPNYSAGSSGPMEGDELLAKDGKRWWNF